MLTYLLSASHGSSLARLSCLILLTFPLQLLAAPFKFAVLPDSQIYSWAVQQTDDVGHAKSVTHPDGTYPFFVDQTQWLAENAASMGIKHVIHLGDIVQHAESIPEWERARAAMNLLDEANLSYGIAVGGHDVAGDDDFTNYLDYFGPQHFAHLDNYFTSPSGHSNYQIIHHEGVDILFMNIAIDTPDDEVTWAQSILAGNHDKIAIISTHKYLWDYRLGMARFGETIQQGLMFAQNFSIGSGRSQQAFYESFVAAHPNILMVMAGHVHGDVQRIDGRNGANQPVLEILADYQDGRNGGDGYLRIYELDLENNKLVGRTYSPSLDRERTNFEGFVESVKVVNDFANSKHLNFLPDLVVDIGLKLMRRDAVPEVNVIAEHPEYQAEPEYYHQLLADLHGGSVPSHIGDLREWEVLWLLTYASNKKEPLDFNPNFRNPNIDLDVTYSDYLTGTLVEKPEPTRDEKWAAFRAGFQSFIDDVLILFGGFY